MAESKETLLSADSTMSLPGGSSSKYEVALKNTLYSIVSAEIVDVSLPTVAQAPSVSLDSKFYYVCIKGMSALKTASGIPDVMCKVYWNYDENGRVIQYTTGVAKFAPPIQSFNRITVEIKNPDGSTAVLGSSGQSFTLRLTSTASRQL